MMDLLPMLSSSADLTSAFLYLRLLLKGKYTSHRMRALLILGRWIFYSAVNSVTPLIVLHLGFETDAWLISVRQLSYTLVTLVVSIPIMYVKTSLHKHGSILTVCRLWATWKKDLKTPLLISFTFFLAV